MQDCDLINIKHFLLGKLKLCELFISIKKIWSIQIVLVYGCCGPDTSYLKGQGDFPLAKGTSMRNLWISIGTFERAPRQRPGATEAIASGASVKYQAWIVVLLLCTTSLWECSTLIQMLITSSILVRATTNKLSFLYCSVQITISFDEYIHWDFSFITGFCHSPRF